MKNFLIPIFALWLSALSGSTSFASEGAPIGAAEVDPPVILSSASNRALIVKWQTSIPGIVASPVEQHRLAANTRTSRSPSAAAIWHCGCISCCYLYTFNGNAKNISRNLL